MHVVLLAAEYPPAPGGVGDYTSQLAAALRANGVRVDVLTIEKGNMVRYAAPETGQQREQRHFVAAARGGWGWQFWPALIRVLDELRPDVLHIQYQTGAYRMHPAINLLPWRLRALPGRPRVVVTFHDLLEPYLFPKAGPLRRLATTRLAADSDAVIVTNAADHARLAAMLAARKTSPHLVPIGSNIPVAPPEGYERAAWRARLGLAPSELVIAYFGLLSPNKGADLLLTALVSLPARLLIIGGEATAPQDQAFAQRFASRVSELGLTARVLFTGHVAPERVSGHLMAADIVALPFRDGASFRRGSLLAALAHGCALVTTQPTDAVAMAQLRHNEQALLVPPDDAGALAAALARLAADPSLRERLGAAGRTLAAAFSWPAIAKDHGLIYLSGLFLLDTV